MGSTLRGAAAARDDRDGEGVPCRGQVRAYAPPGPARRSVVTWAAQYTRATGQQLELLVDEHRDTHGRWAATVRRVLGTSCAERLVRASAGARLLVVSQLVPDVAEVVDRAYEPVAVVPEDRPGHEQGPVVVALSGRTGDEVLGAAFDLAARRRAPLVAVRVRDAAARPGSTRPRAVSPVGDERDERQGWEDHLSLWPLVHPDVPVTVHVLDGDPVDVLTGLSRSAWLLVLGRSGRGRLLDTVSASPVAALVRTARCPVLVVPRPGPPRRSWWPCTS